MKPIHAAIAIASGLLLALWWSVAPPRFAPDAGAPLGQLQQHQCPSTSRLVGKLCTCPAGSAWSDSTCKPAWNGSARLLPVAPRPGSLARMERVVGEFTGTGNIAIVESVDATSLTIIEGDGRGGALVRRSASAGTVGEAARKLGIVGYVAP